MQSLDSNFTNKHTLSKPKPRLYVLIMVCQHNTNWSSNTLVPKVLETNNYVHLIQFLFYLKMSRIFKIPLSSYSIQPWSFKSYLSSQIQIDHACLSSRGFNSLMTVKSYPSFQDSIRPCSFNLMQIQFDHDHLIISTFSRFNSTVLV